MPDLDKVGPSAPRRRPKLEVIGSEPAPESGGELRQLRMVRIIISVFDHHNNFGYDLTVMFGLIDHRWFDAAPLVEESRCP
jgi:hypothetical protein